MDRKGLDWLAQLKEEGKLETFARHEQVMAIYKLVEERYPKDEVLDVVLDVFPGLTEGEFFDHLMFDAMRQLAPVSH